MNCDLSSEIELIKETIKFLSHFPAVDVRVILRDQGHEREIFKNIFFNTRVF